MQKKKLINLGLVAGVILILALLIFMAVLTVRQSNNTGQTAALVAVPGTVKSSPVATTTSPLTTLATQTSTSPLTTLAIPTSNQGQGLTVLTPGVAVGTVITDVSGCGNSDVSLSRSDTPPQMTAAEALQAVQNYQYTGFRVNQPGIAGKIITATAIYGAGYILSGAPKDTSKKRNMWVFNFYNAPFTPASPVSGPLTYSITVMEVDADTKEVFGFSICGGPAKP